MFREILSITAVSALLACTYAGPDSSKLFFWHAFPMGLATYLAYVGIFMRQYSKIDLNQVLVPSFLRGKVPKLPLPGQVHNYLLSTAMGLMTVGVYAIYTNKTRGGKEHFTSLHGRIGIAVFAVAVLLTAYSLPAFWLAKGKTRQIVDGLGATLYDRSRGVHKTTGMIILSVWTTLTVTGWYTLHSGNEGVMFFQPFLPVLLFVPFSLYMVNRAKAARKQE